MPVFGWRDLIYIFAKRSLLQLVCIKVLEEAGETDFIIYASKLTAAFVQYSTQLQNRLNIIIDNIIMQKKILCFLKYL